MICHTKFGPDQFRRFEMFWIQNNIKTRFINVDFGPYCSMFVCIVEITLFLSKSTLEQYHNNSINYIFTIFKKYF